MAKEPLPAQAHYEVNAAENNNAGPQGFWYWHLHKGLPQHQPDESMLLIKWSRQVSDHMSSSSLPTPHCCQP